MDENKKAAIKKYLKIAALIGIGLFVVILAGGTFQRSSSPMVSDIDSGYRAQGIVGEAMPVPNPLRAAPGLFPEIVGEIMGNKSAQIKSGESKIPPSTTDRKVVKTSEIKFVVKSTSGALKAVSQIAAENGGFVDNANVSKTSDNKLNGYIQIKVPADKFENAMESVEKSDLIEEVLSKNINSRDVTKEFIDYSARLKVLAKTEMELMNLLGRSGNLGDILNVQRELNNIRTQIEQQQSQFNYLTSQIDYSTITVYLSEEIPEFLGIRWKPVVKIKQEIQNLLNGLRNYGDFAIAFFFHYLPLLIIWAATVGFGVWVLNKFYQKLKAKFNWQFQPSNFNFTFWLKVLGLLALGLIVARLLF